MKVHGPGTLITQCEAQVTGAGTHAVRTPLCEPESYETRKKVEIFKSPSGCVVLP